MISMKLNVVASEIMIIPRIVGSVKNYCYRVGSRITIFGMRGLWGLTIRSGRGAMLKYLLGGIRSKNGGFIRFVMVTQKNNLMQTPLESVIERESDF